jgi:hypothetical protein
MSERQAHGFAFERRIIGILGLRPADSYCAAWDAFDGDMPVSVKTAREGSEIDLGSLRRNAAIDRDFTLVLGTWDSDPRVITRIRALRISGEWWRACFDAGLLHEAAVVIGMVSNRRSDDGIWSELTGDIRDRWAERTANLVRPRFKRDHKAQKRVQCAISASAFATAVLPAAAAAPARFAALAGLTPMAAA